VSHGCKVVLIISVNTNRIIHASFAVKDGLPIESGKMMLGGVGSPGAPIRLDFTDPAGSMTGTLLPTGSAVETITIDKRTLQVSCVDAANPFIFVRASDLGIDGSESLETLHKQYGDVLMDVRAQMAVRMGLARSAEAARLVNGTPKIALVGAPASYTTASGRVEAEDIDIWVRPYSMGKPHPSIQMTGAVCVAAAAVVPGSVVNLLARPSGSSLVIGHGGGTMTTEGKSFVDEDGQVVVERGSVYRTARRLMEGTVLYLAK
jgi:2-methylaconitate cis-trans-isomerase PrpF